MKTSLKLLMLAAVLTLSSCHHKDLIYDQGMRTKVEVVFDWTDAPDANPESMGAYFYPLEGGASLRYIFTGRDGGDITIPLAGYCALGMNTDDTDWAVTSYTDDIDRFETSTAKVSRLEAYSIPARSLPRARGTEDEELVATPGMLWSARKDDIRLDDGKESHTIVFRPEEAVCHYTVEVEDVKNIEYAHGATIDGTLSGMSRSFIHGSASPSETAATMPFTLKADQAQSMLQSNFLTFGESPSAKNSHILTIYLCLSDGSCHFYTYDVSDQIHNAPDPRHVLIRVSGLEIPVPLASPAAGFAPDVNDWVSQNIDLPMQTSNN